MTVILNTRADITLKCFDLVSKGESVSFSKDALDRMTVARKYFMDMINGDPSAFVYGVTSGYGNRSHLKFDLEQRLRHAQTLPNSIGAFGDPLPTNVIRGIVLARLANFIDGHAAVSPEVAIAVAAMLSQKEFPEITAGGQGGAGEILSLGILFSELAAKTPRGEKDTLALINGSPAAAALVADVALIARRRIKLAYSIFCLSVEAFKAPVDAYDPAFETLWGDRNEARALKTLNILLAGARTDRRSYQAPVSYRVLPRALGLAERAVEAAEEAATTSLCSVTDNPVFLMPTSAYPSGRAISNGGFHNMIAWPAINTVAGVWAELCLIADRHTDKLHNGRLSLLPERLVHDDVQVSTAALGMVQAGYGEEARHAAQRTFTPPTEGGGEGVDDLAPPTFLAWSRERRAGLCFDASLAILAVVASQALYVQRGDVAPKLVSLLDAVRTIFPPVTTRRMYSSQLKDLAGTFTDAVYGNNAALDVHLNHF